MSADITDVARIQDEDVLRRMWQETDDFGRKKEIRSHMYKLREARLKDFYNSADVNTEISRSTTTSTTENTSKTNMSTTHADSLADQSYVTLKSKEVRDSESPTRDSYNKSIAKHQDQGWTINSSNERSIDGKTNTSTHTASTSGTQQIDGGKVDYAAKLEEKASVYQGGDDKNFTKAVGTSSSSTIRQEAFGGDENSNFRSTSSKTSSSSRYVSESKNTSEDVQAIPSATREQVPYSTINEDNAKSVIQKTFTSNIPSDLKSHPSYVDGKTKVIQETKTLADGTIVTTTRYETKEGNSTRTATHKKYANIPSSQVEQRSASTKTHQHYSTNVSSDRKQSIKNDQRAIEYIVEPGSVIEVNVKGHRENTDFSDVNRNEKISSQQTTKVVRESTQNEQVNRQHDVDVKKNRRIVQDKIEYVEIPFEIPTENVTTKTTTTKMVVSQVPQEFTDTQRNVNVLQKKVDYVKSPVDQTVTTKTTTTKTIVSDQVPREQTNTTYHTTSTHVINQNQDVKDSKRIANDQFISTERQHEVDTREFTTKRQEPLQQAPREHLYETPKPSQPVSPSESERYPKAPQEPYVQPEKRQAIKPGKSEMDQKPTPTDGQYDTTYRSDYTSKKISVEVSATHDAFARSLRSVTPERITRNSPRTNSNTSLRSTSSPEKNRYPTRSSPDRHDTPKGPKKTTERFSSTETITYKTNRQSPPRKSPERSVIDRRTVNSDLSLNKTTKSDHYSTDTVTRRSNISKDQIITDTIDSNTITRRKTRPRSPSPTGTTTSDFEYVRNTHDITSDLDIDYSNIQKVSNKETSTIKDTRPSSLDITTRKVKKVTERSPTSPLTDISSTRRSPTKESPRKEKSPTKDVSPSFEKPKLLRTDTYEERVKEILGLTKDTQEVRRSSLERNSSKRSSLREVTTRKTSSDEVTKRLTKTSPTKESPSRKSPEKQYPDRRSPVKEFPSQIRKSPEKLSAEQSPDRRSPTKEKPTIAEFPSQVRKSPERKPANKTQLGPSEFPSQVRKSPEKQPLDSYPEKKSPSKSSPNVSEFPSQIRKSPEKQSLPPYPEKASPNKTGPSISEFPSQVRRSPEREQFEVRPNKKSPSKTTPASEFPSYNKKSPERELRESYPERKSPTKSGPAICEFPLQTRRSPEREPLPSYPGRTSPSKFEPSVSEFPSQIRRSPEKESLQPYPQRTSPTKFEPSISEFPSHIRKSPEREPLQPYPKRTSPTKFEPSISEFPSQIRKSPEKEPLQPYPERTSPSKFEPTICEFPSQIRKSPEREPLQPYPERTSPSKYDSSISEFPSQIRKSPEKEPLEPYPERTSPDKYESSIAEFPSQIRRSPERQPLESYPQKLSEPKSGPSVNEFPSQVRKTPKREPLEPYPETKTPSKTGPSISEYPPQHKKSPEKEPSQKLLEKPSPTKKIPSVNEFPSQVRKTPKKQQAEPYSEKKPVKKVPSSVSEFPSQIRKTFEKQPPQPYPEKRTPKKDSPSISEFPSQARKSPEKQPFENATTVPSKKPTDFSSPRSVTKTTTLSKKSPKKPNKLRTDSESSTTSEEEDIEDLVTVTTVETVESRIPVAEPIAEKKLFSQLCREHEVTTINKKKTTQELIEAEIHQNEVTKQQTGRITKKDKPIPNGVAPKEKPTKPSTKKLTTTADHIKTEITSRISSIKKDVPKEKSPIKKPIDKTPPKKILETTTTSRITKKESPKTTYSARLPTPKKQPETIYRVEKTKFIGETEYQDEFSKLNKLKREPVKKPIKPGTKTTLYDIEHTENIKEDKSVHLRTNRVDDTVTKKKVTKTILVNGDVNKPKVKDSPARIPSPTKKVPVSVTSSFKPVEKIIEVKPKQTTITQSRYSTTVRKTINEAKPKGPKTTEPKKHVVTTTITMSPKTSLKSKQTTKTTSSKTVSTDKKTTASRRQTTKRVSNGYVSSDTEDDSTTESVEGSFVDLTDKRSRFTRTESDQTFNTVPRQYQPEPYSDNEENTRRVITTKTVLITNEDAPDREVIVNLQRSKSSREPTPDRLCPRPLTSDEEEDASPVRYPDQISEPDDGTFKRKPKKLSDIPIFETDDTTEFTRITEMTDIKNKITKVDKVEETDESLLSIDKKINKFLNTADHLTKEPLKPKPAKVGRPSLEVSEDLREDECLLSVSDKVSKFISTAEQLTTSKLPDRPKSPRPKTYDEGVNVNIQQKVTEYKTSTEESAIPKKLDKGPATKVPRPDLKNLDDNLKEDECMLSVSDKVSKFISTAEKLTSPTKPVSLSKIEMQAKPAEQSPKRERVSPNREIGFKSQRSPSKDITTDFIHTERREEISTRKSPSLSPERRRSPSPGDKTPKRRPSNQYTSILKTETRDSNYTPEQVYPESTPKSTRRHSQEDSKINISSTTRLRSTESIKKAKALFENIGKEHDTPWQKDVLSRPSVIDAKKSVTEQTTRKTDVEKKQETVKSVTQRTTEDKTKTTKLIEVESRRSPSPKKYEERKPSPERIEITRFRPSSPEKIPEVVIPQRDHLTTKPRSREATPDGDLPHYMKPLDRSLRPNSPHRDSISQAKPQQPPQTVDQVETKQTKFGVTLRRTDSARTSKVTESSTSTSERRKSSITLEKRVTEEEVEEIFDLEILEELLEKVVSYELRRKIRTQIRLVKKLISEGTLEVYISKKKSLPREITRRGSSPSKTVRPEGYSKTETQTTYVRKLSPERKVVDNKMYDHTDIVDRKSSIQQSSEYQSSYSYNERRSSTDCSKISRKSVSPTRDRPSPQRSSPERRVSKTVDVTPGGKVTTVKTTEVTPGGSRTTTTKTTEKTFTTLKKTAPPSKKPVEDTQPEWVRQRNLRNAKESGAPTAKKATTSTSTSTTKKSTLRSSPAKEVKGTDIITSSYGVGPTDENGTPLFGLKALRAQNKNEKLKVQGTVIRSEYYSENDQEPVGQVSVTKYSNDPRDLDQDGVISTHGKIASVTTTQKFGYKDTPSLRSLSDNKKEICDTTDKSTTKTTKVNRRGSVKEISKKFIDNAVETLKSERQTTYPKAGLILRSSSFKSTNGEDQSDSRESSPADDREAESSTVTVRTMRTSTSGETFLSNKNKVSGVQDVITRMKNEEYQEGDTEEDIAARGLLNKFIGSQVILSGMEARASSSTSKTTTSSSPSGTVRRSTKITTTVTEGGKPTTTTRVFQRPVTENELDTVWDEQSLRLLLEQSTDYEERRIIRVRLRQVMAEQEEAVETTKEVKKEGDVTTTKVTTKVTQQQARAPKPMSPFAKFRQLDKQNSVNKPTPPRTFN